MLTRSAQVRYKFLERLWRLRENGIPTIQHAHVSRHDPHIETKWALGATCQ
jgi:hypothetical protein